MGKLSAWLIGAPIFVQTISASAAAELNPLFDQAATNATIAARLDSLLQKRDGLIVLKGDFHVWVFSANTPWMVDCGLGASVFFGPVFGADASSVEGSPPEAKLALFVIPESRCDELAPLIGARVLAILGN